jgi:gamma-glutamyl:cysteine ligase YbdK (ATP-grasp superfamily)
VARGWAAFRAARDGTGATVLDGDTPRPLAQIARDTARRVRPLAREAGDEDALDGIEAILAAGGAARRRASFARGGMPEMLAALVDETAQTGLAAVHSA